MTGGRSFYTRSYLDKQAKEQQPKDVKETKEVKEEPKAVEKTLNTNAKEFIPSEATTAPTNRKPVTKPKPKIKGKDAVMSEIEQLQKRFTNLKITNKANPSIVDFNLPITDPDFPYDLDDVHLSITLPSDYPQSPPKFEVLNEAIPINLRQRLSSRLNETASQIKRGELSVRPMLRYLERNLEAILSAKTAIKFIPAGAMSVSPISESGTSESTIVQETASVLLQSSPEQAAIDFSSNEDQIKMRTNRFQPGTFIKLQERSDFTGNGAFQLYAIQNDRAENNYSIAVLCSLSLTVTCQKCSANNDICDIRIESERLHNCTRCSRQMSLEFWPKYMTIESTLIGQCRFTRCRPVDLLPSQWHLECPECQDSVRVNQVKNGEHIKYPCRQCASVMSFVVDGSKWVDLSTLDTASTGNNKKSKERLAVTIGEPLPKYGACEHYAKSFRWYRFPCCGRVFPCDRCHDLLSQPPHPMEWANRFLCGHCSREHHINDVNKVCQCGVDPTKRHTAHWEGGRGMRDQTSMSKKDNKKYRGLSK